MVFESMITDLMNKYLGDFVENLDKSQLKLSIWGGDIVLNDLDLKQSALDNLDLPVTVKSGHLGKLTLNIPWKNLYSAPVVAIIDGLYLLAVPNTDIKYDEQKASKKKQDVKKKELDKVEMAKQNVKDKGKQKEDKSDSFAEKMAFQIIKNLQVQISNIHVRYEDKYTNPAAPFGIGVTLHNLSFQTCDANWKTCIADSSTTLIHKLVELDSLAVYWNTSSEMYSDLPREKLRDVLKRGIAGTRPSLYQFLIKPISMKAQVRINPKPASDLSIPKVYLNLVLQEIGVSLSKKQFRDVMELLESFERMVRNEPYRKYRPNVPAKGNAKVWWHYAQNCILHESVKRKSSMWSWNNISKHRELSKKYKAAWKEKIWTKKPSKAVMDSIQVFEGEMNVFSIVLARQQAETEVAKAGSKVKKSKSKEKGGGWSGIVGLFGGGKKKVKEKEDKPEEKAITQQIAKELTGDEQSKLFAAIGYTEGVADPTLPIDYVGMKFHFKLQKTSLQLTDSSLRKPEIVNLKLDDMYAYVQQRPSADSIKFEAKIDSLSVYGCELKNGKIPQMVKSQRSDSGHLMSLLDVQLETNPIDGKADQRISVKARPLEVVYDAQTVNHIADFFKPPDDVHLKKLQAAAFSKLDALKSQSTSRLTYMIHTRKVTDITIDLKSSYIIIPERGVLESSSSVLVVNLGDFKMKSQQQEKVPEWRKQENLPLEELLLKAYDKFNIQLDSMQVLLARPGEDWMSARSEPKSSLHILEPTAVNVQLQKCMIPNDVRMPAMKISGELPHLCVNVSDHKIHQLVKLGTSIPLPEIGEAKAKTGPSKTVVIPGSPQEITAGYSMVAPQLTIPGQEDILVEYECDDESTSTSTSTSTVSDEFYTPSQSTEELARKFCKVSDEPVEQLTNLELKFEVKEVLLNVYQWKNGKEAPLLSLAVQHVGTEIKQRTYDLNVNAFLGSVMVEHKQFKGPDGHGPLYLVSTQSSAKSQTDNLLSVHYRKVDKKSPEFHTTYEKTEQSIDIAFTTLEVVAHLNAILDMMDFADSIIPKPDEKKELKGPDDEGYITDEEKTHKQEHVRSTHPVPRSEIDVRVKATLDVVSLLVCSDNGTLATVKVNGIEAGVIVQKHKTTINASLKDIVVLDSTPYAKYPKILSIKDTQVLNLHVVAHNGATLGENYSDMNAVDTEVKLKVGRIGVVFLNKFVSQILEFVDHFQTAKDAVKGAGASAASSAKATVKDLHQRSARVLLDITIQAPLVIVPQSSTSNRAIVADLGVLTVKNEFKIIDARVNQVSPPIVDTMYINLRSVKLSRALVTQDRIKSEIMVLEPVDIIVDVTRNLAASWYHKIPNISISGKLPALKVSLEQNDFAVVMATLDENLGEGKKMDAIKDFEDKDDDVDSAKSTEVDKQKNKKQQTSSVEVTKPTDVWTNLVFSFEIASISAALYVGKTDLEGRDGIISRKSSNGLCRADVFIIKVDGTMYTDNSIGAKVVLGNLILDDTRPGRDKGIYRMFEKYVPSKDVDADKVNSIELDFKQVSNQDKIINTQVKNLYICVCLEFLLTIADFFTKGLPQKEPKKKKVPTATLR